MSTRDTVHVSTTGQAMQAARRTETLCKASGRGNVLVSNLLHRVTCADCLALVRSAVAR